MIKEPRLLVEEIVKLLRCLAGLLGQVGGLFGLGNGPGCWGVGLVNWAWVAGCRACELGLGGGV